MTATHLGREKNPEATHSKLFYLPLGEKKKEHMVIKTWDPHRRIWEAGELTGEHEAYVSQCLIIRKLEAPGYSDALLHPRAVVLEASGAKPTPVGLVKLQGPPRKFPIQQARGGA